MQAVVRTIDALSEAEIRRWDVLLDGHAPYMSPFLTREWCLAVHRHRGGVHVLILSDGGRIVGYLPFQMKRGRHWLGHAEKVGGQMSDCFDIIGRPEFRGGGLNVLGLAKLSALTLDHMPAELATLGLSDVEHSTGIRVVIDDFPAYMTELARANKKLIVNVRRGERQLATQIGEVRFSWNVADTLGELDRLIDQKRAQYRRTHVPDGLAPPWKRKLLRGLFTEPSQLKPVLSTLHSGQTWMATCLSLAYKDVLHIWFPAYNSEYHRFSPGHVLFFKLFEHATSLGFRIFDFGEGASQYKRAYRGEDYVLLKGRLHSQSLLGFSAKLIEAAQWRINRLRYGLRARDKTSDIGLAPPQEES